MEGNGGVLFVNPILICIVCTRSARFETFWECFFYTVDLHTKFQNELELQQMDKEFKSFTNLRVHAPLGNQNCV